MVVGKRLKRTAGHHVPEVPRRVKAGDLGGEPLADAEMPRLPRDGLTQPDQATGASRDGPLTGMPKLPSMEVDVPREIKTYLNRGSDPRHDPETGHYPPSDYFAE